MTVLSKCAVSIAHVSVLRFAEHPVGNACESRYSYEKSLGGEAFDKKAQPRTDLATCIGKTHGIKWKRLGEEDNSFSGLSIHLMSQLGLDFTLFSPALLVV